MKTQISRHSHRPEKRYSGVYQQQGRMLTDADWNELVEILRRRLDEALRDAVDGGAPRERGMELVDAPLLEGGQRFRIRPGRIYAGGAAAEVVAEDGVTGAFRFDQQADFPGIGDGNGDLPDAPYVLYADVWERSVVALTDPEEVPPEDPEEPFSPHLRDPALHGADTTTRTQTMAQIKWAPTGDDPEDPARNPPRGDALLDLTLRAQQEQADPCDPCADEVAIATRTGNYLFRLEVHDVEGDPAAPDRITLKWSSENGAEQHAVGSEPPEFKTGAWVYELYDETSEKHLGVHLATTFEPTRGELIPKGRGEDYGSITPSGAPPWVRRWDGRCTLLRDGTEWFLLEDDGWDRTAPLTTTAGENDHGRVGLADGGVTINLRSLTLRLTLADRTFVAGDYWLAPVREVTHGEGDPVLAEAPPVGIVHHYLRLAEVDGEGALLPLETDARRRLSFPPLTDIRAGDVGYETGCEPDGATPLFDAGQDTVQKALDQLCHLAAEHVAYDGSCDSGLFDGSQATVDQALDRLCELAAEHVAYGGSCDSGLFDGSQATVRDALDRLCQLAAGHVGYEPHSECEDLQDVSTVQQALDALCLRPTGGSVSREIVQPGHGFRVGEAIHFDADAGEYRRARADRPITTGLFLVSEVDGEDEFTLLQAGYLDLVAGYAPEEVPEELLLEPGQYYFVSADEAGALTPEEPSSGLSNPILYADAKAGGYVLPWRPSDPVSTGEAAQEYIDRLFVGTVAAFAMEEPPEGWLECNGQAIGRGEHARLFERIGTRFGAGNGATTFNVPDLRGEFVRGWDHGRGVDPERALGTPQGHLLQSHHHAVLGWSPHPHDPMGEIWNNGWGMIKYQRSSFVTNAVGGSETRPRNLALLFCIKY